MLSSLVSKLSSANGAKFEEGFTIALLQREGLEKSTEVGKHRTDVNRRK